MIVPEPSTPPAAPNSLSAAEAIVFGARARGKPAVVAAAFLNDLSEREQEILALVSSGFSNADVARHLDLSIETVKSHMRRILGKLGARNRCHAVALGYEHGLLRPGGLTSPGDPPPRSAGATATGSEAAPVR